MSTLSQSISTMGKNTSKKFNGLIRMKNRNSVTSVKKGSSGKSSGGESTFSNILIKTISIIIVIVLILLAANIVYYFLSDCYEKKPLLHYLSSFSLDPCAMKDESKTKSLPYAVREVEDDEEVFHIGNQDYTYEQAKCKCTAYGGRLATKTEIIDAYNKGADWCSYGWSEGQAAYYPTQKCTWDKLQREGNNKYNCGMPGVNGGFFSDPLLKFGVNCYGVKPDGKVAKEKKPKCKKKDFCERKINHNASHKMGTDQLVPFNDKKWSQY